MNSNEVMVKMIMDRWFALIKNCDDLLAVLSDEQLLQPIAPGKNRGIYLLGHLVAVHDDMLRLLGFGEKQYSDLFEPFIKTPDNEATMFPLPELRARYASQNAVMAEKINAMTAEQWFEPHTAVGAEDFAKEPHRNKLNIMLTRATHLSYHIGQLMMLKK